MSLLKKTDRRLKENRAIKEPIVPWKGQHAATYWYSVKDLLDNHLLDLAAYLDRYHYWDPVMQQFKTAFTKACGDLADGYDRSIHRLSEKQ